MRHHHDRKGVLPRDERPGAEESTGRHRTVMAAVVRQPDSPPGAARTHRKKESYLSPSSLSSSSASSAVSSGAWTAAQAGPDAEWEAEDAAGEWREGDPETRIIYDREQGQVPALIPALTLPQRSVRSAGATLAQFGRGAVAASRALARRPSARRQGNTLSTEEPGHGRERTDVLSVGRQFTAASAVRRHLSAATARHALIPGKPTAKVAVVVPRGQPLARPALRTRPLAFLAACVAMLMAVTAAGVTARNEISDGVGNLFQVQSGIHVLPTPIGGYWEPPIDSNAPPAPSIVDAGHYVYKYGFDWPASAQPLAPDERTRLMAMLPFALAATARWDARFGDSLEPQMLLFWTHAEGITGHVSYSNCANEYPPWGYSYFTYITNCNDPGFWQLGFGNQFGVIDILKTAFVDMRGDPNDPRLVQRVGQAVINWDRQQGTSPVCGGYSCTFPAETIDQIMAGVSLSYPTEDDWWASVLSRDPAINCYMLARALVWFNHNATRNWVGCYYVEPCWSYESNRLGDILAAWNSLRAGAGV